jgi:hypothetical protein
MIRFCHNGRPRWWRPGPGSRVKGPPVKFRTSRLEAQVTCHFMRFLIVINRRNFDSCFFAFSGVHPHFSPIGQSIHAIQPNMPPPSLGRKRHLSGPTACNPTDNRTTGRTLGCSSHARTRHFDSLCGHHGALLRALSLTAGQKKATRGPIQFDVQRSCPEQSSIVLCRNRLMVIQNSQFHR